MPARATLSRALRPFEHTGDSANIAYYAERDGRSSEAYVWCSVLHSVPMKRRDDDVLVLNRSRPRTYFFTIYRNRGGKIAESVLERPLSPTPDGPLSPRTVARVVRKALAGE